MHSCLRNILTWGRPFRTKNLRTLSPSMRGRPQCPFKCILLYMTQTQICNTSMTPIMGDKLSYDKIVEKALKGLIAKVHGFTLKETKIVYDQTEEGEKHIKSETITVKNVGPDLSAIMFVLTNLDGQHWKGKTGVTRDNDMDDEDTLELTSLSDEVLKMLMDSFQSVKKSAGDSNSVKNENI